MSDSPRPYRVTIRYTMGDDTVPQTREYTRIYAYNLGEAVMQAAYRASAELPAGCEPKVESAEADVVEYEAVAARILKNALGARR